MADWLSAASVVAAATPIGTALESRFGNVEIDGKVGKMNEGSLTISCPVTNLEEMGDEYPGEGIDTKRAITLSRSINMRAKDGVEFGKGYRGYELPVTALAGKNAGLTLAPLYGTCEVQYTGSGRGRQCNHFDPGRNRAWCQR